jgi:hypothetical protein
MIGSAAPALRRPAEAAFLAFPDFTDARDFFFTIRFRILPPFHRGRVALRGLIIPPPIQLAGLGQKWLKSSVLHLDSQEAQAYTQASSVTDS